MKNLTSPVCYIAYAGGFAMGNFIGMSIAEKLSLGVVLIRIVTKKDATELEESLKYADYGVTSVDGHGSTGQVMILFTIVPRREANKVVDLIKQFNPKAFYTIEEVGFVEKGILPPKQVGVFTGFSQFFRPFRKGK